MSETFNGAELARLLLRSGTTAAEIAATDVESLTETVADRRKRMNAFYVIDPALGDHQIAQSILEYARSEPSDWPAQTPSQRYARTVRHLVFYLSGGFCLLIALSLVYRGCAELLYGPQSYEGTCGAMLIYSVAAPFLCIAVVLLLLGRKSSLTPRSDAQVPEGRVGEGKEAE